MASNDTPVIEIEIPTDECSSDDGNGNDLAKTQQQPPRSFRRSKIRKSSRRISHAGAVEDCVSIGDNEDSTNHCTDKFPEDPTKQKFSQSLRDIDETESTARTARISLSREGSEENIIAVGEDENSDTPGWRKFLAEVKYLWNEFNDYCKNEKWYKRACAYLVYIVFFFVVYDLAFGKQDFIVNWLHSFVVWMTAHPKAATAAFVGTFVFSIMLYAPPSLLVFGAGYGFAVLYEDPAVSITVATILCFLSSCIGAILGFHFRSRWIFRDVALLVVNRYPWARALDRALQGKHGFRIMLMLRLCPIVPFHTITDGCGMSAISLYDYSLSLVGLIPFQTYTIVLGTIARATEVRHRHNDFYLGMNKEEIAPSQRWAFLAFILLGILFTLIAVVYTWRLVRRELKKELDELSTEDNDEALDNKMRNSRVTDESTMELSSDDLV